MKKIVRLESPEVIAALMADMAEHIEIQKRELEHLRSEKAKQDQQSFNIEEKLKLIRRSIYGRRTEKRVDASDRPRTQSQIDNLIFSQAMFPTNEVRDDQGKTINTRWENPCFRMQRILKQGLAPFVQRSASKTPVPYGGN